MKLCRVHLVAAARPNFMKVAPLWHALSAATEFQPMLIHTGQHYDPNMSDKILEDLRLPAPDHHLGVGSGTHAEQTGGVMMAYEKVALEDRPDWLIVVGDVNSTAACAMVGGKLRIPVIHLEAGLRSRDRTMPEELNRIVTDAIADVLWTPSPDADDNLRAEGVAAERISRVGNIMLDSFEMVRPLAEAAKVPEEMGVADTRYGVVTLHRPSNVDTTENLSALVVALASVQQELPLVFPVHPRTAQQLERTGLGAALQARGVLLVEPLSYVRFMSLVMNAAVVITDSGGIQEETTYLGIPCMTLRKNTERPITITQGTNRLVDPASLVPQLRQALAARLERPRPELWDGHTATRCVADLRSRIALARSQERAPA